MWCRVPHVSFAKALAGALQIGSMSQAELARQIDVHPSTIGRWVDGRPLDQLDQVAAMEDALGLRRGQLFIDAGYVDVDIPSARSAIEHDGTLSPMLRRIVLDAYDSAHRVAADDVANA